MIWHSSSAENVINELKTDAERGLASGEVPNRLELHGSNKTSIGDNKSFASRFLSQLNSKVIYFLIIISVLSFAVDIVYHQNNLYFPLLIIAIVVLNALISAFHLHKCDEALNNVYNAAKPSVTVLRDGKIQVRPSESLVPGDVILLKEGDYITADARLIESDALRCNEAILTGEIVPVEKYADILLEDITPASQRRNMVFSGCSVVHGTAKAVVVETGLKTEIGKIADISRQTNSQTLPITESLNNSGKLINVSVLVFCIIAFIIGMFQIDASLPFASSTLNVLMNTVALGISAMPESLPAISTVVIALGIQRMISDNIVIKNTKALELLGKTEVFCVDKTGILTKNDMSLKFIHDGTDLIELGEDALPEKAASVLQLATACSMLENDSTETAIENACKKYVSMSKTDIDNLSPRLAAIPFDSVRKTMTSISMINGTPVAIVKGAPEILLEKCNLENKDALKLVCDNLTKDSYRVLLIALKKLDEIPSSPNPDEIERDLTFVGILGIYDPPQSDTAEAVSLCKIAGIHTVMMTGDSLVTAKTIAEKIGILTDDSQAITGSQLEEITDEQLMASIEKYTVFARITPEDKHRIITVWQKLGKIVAVTGTGTEDADALATADIGCAVGNYGTDIAKGNADVIIERKKFMSVVKAIQESRSLFENVKKAITYLLGCNFAEILVFILGMLIFGKAPFAAVQLLWINLLTDSTSVISLTFEKSEFDVMRQKPLALTGHLFSKGATVNIICDVLVITALTLASYTIGGTSLAFSTLAMVQIFHSYNCKTHDTILKADFKSNKFMNFSSVLVLFISIFLVLTPAGSVFGIEALAAKEFFISLGLAIAIIPICEIKKFASRQLAKRFLI